MVLKAGHCPIISIDRPFHQLRIEAIDKSAGASMGQTVRWASSVVPPASCVVNSDQDNGSWSGRSVFKGADRLDGRPLGHLGGRFCCEAFVRHGCKLENAGLLRKVRCRHGVCFQVGLSFFKKFATALWALIDHPKAFWKNKERNGWA